jgi:hypothetical protein
MVRLTLRTFLCHTATTECFALPDTSTAARIRTGDPHRTAFVVISIESSPIDMSHDLPSGKLTVVSFQCSSQQEDATTVT